MLAAMWRAARRLDDRTPELQISTTATTLFARAHTWAWPSFQMGVAAALSWLLASLFVSDPGYAPIAAIVALGLGRDRRVSYSAFLVGGMLVGVIAAEALEPMLGRGWWQIGVALALTAMVTGAILDVELAVSYAAINVIVLLSLPDSGGLVPARLIAALAGVVVALAVILVIAPSRPVHLLRRRLDGERDAAATALRATADSLRNADPGEDQELGDARPLLRCARRVDDQIDRSYDAVSHALEIVRWSPWRRSSRHRVTRLAAVAADLRPTLRTASTIARLGDRAVVLGIRADEQLVEALDRAADVIEDLMATLVDGDNADARSHAEPALENLMKCQLDHAILIAMQEEIRGLLADTAETVERHCDGTASSIRERSRGARVDGVQFGTQRDSG